MSTKWEPISLPTKLSRIVELHIKIKDAHGETGRPDRTSRTSELMDLLIDGTPRGVFISLYHNLL